MPPPTAISRAWWKRANFARICFIVSMVVVRLPPLRERQNDILLLNHYLALFNEENKKQINGFELKDAGTPKHQCVQLFNDLVHLLRLRTEFRQGTGRPFRMRNTALSNLIHLRNSYIDLLQPFRLLIA